MIDLAFGVPVCGFTGINGAGKTLLAVESAISDMRAGRVVYSTVPIVCGDLVSRPIRSLRELLELEDCTILFDEVSVIFSSRSTMTLPAEVVALLQTLRHRRLTVRWTAPDWMRCDNLLRGVTQGLVSVSPLLRVHGSSPWPRPRLIMAGLLDTTSGAVDATPTRVLRRKFARPTRLAAWGSYDTYADTPLLGQQAISAVCVDCGGSVTRPKHTEERHGALSIPWYDSDAHMRAVTFSHDDHQTGVRSAAGERETLSRMVDQPPFVGVPAEPHREEDVSR